MSGFLSWVDFSPSERERMRRAISLFKEQETLDELGLGTVRDGFADGLFPGTSTIQTRLRYFLFVPWVYRELERKYVGASEVAARARKREAELIDGLKQSGDTLGIIGLVAGGAVQRLPSNIYWNGLGAWKIRWFPGSQDEYHRSFDRLRALHRSGLRTDDDGVPVDAPDTWHPRLPEPPERWPGEASFQLTLEEAEFLKGRILHAHPRSVLAHFAEHGKPSRVASPWLHPEAGRLPADRQHELDMARRFAFVMHGAQLLYNLLLAEMGTRADREELIAKYRARLEDWADSQEASQHPRLDTTALWELMEGWKTPVPPRTQHFVNEWVRLCADRDLRQVIDDEAARQLVRHREQRIKTARSRFTNRRAFDQWSGASATQRLEFRWSAVQGLLNDLHAGLGRTE